MPERFEATAGVIIKIHTEILNREFTSLAWRSDGLDEFLDADTQTRHVAASGGSRVLIDGLTSYERTLVQLADAYRVGMASLARVQRVSVWRNPLQGPDTEGTAFEVFSIAINRNGGQNTPAYNPAAVGSYTFRDNARKQYRIGLKAWGFPLGGKYALPANNVNIDPLYEAIMTGGFTSRYGGDIVQGLRVTTSTWDSIERTLGFR